MPLEIIRNDITKVHADAIVNAANETLTCGGGVCGAIFDAAGKEELQKECESIGGCRTGEAVITKGYNLPAKYILHTAGPVWRGGQYNEEELLSSCYKNSLKLAKQHGLESVAFPLISSGIYGYPRDKALKIAVSAIGEFLLINEMTVTLVVYDRESFSISEKLFQSVSRYIDDHYVSKRKSNYERNITDSKSCTAQAFLQEPLPIQVKKEKSKRSLDDLVSRLDESFSQMLLRLIDEKGKTDVEIYKKANIDRKLFSKIRSDAGYKPSKITAVAFAIALELSLDETKDLLCRAGFALSHSSRFDVIIEYFIEDRNYNIYEINNALFAFDQSLLGA
ncbi:MAG: macro domain-containing protein [Eubacteriales bacterium]